MTSATPMVEADVSLGMRVEKFMGEARWFGVVVADYQTGKNSRRIVVEVEPQGFQMIAVPSQLRPAPRTPAPFTPVAEGIVERLRDLIGEYFDLGYAEGVTGRDADTPNGDAQRVWSEIASTIAALSEENRLSMQTIADERERADKAEAALATARNDVLEEAAKVAEAEETLMFDDKLGRELSNVRKAHARSISTAIRSIKRDSTP